MEVHRPEPSVLELRDWRWQARYLCNSGRCVILLFVNGIRP